NFTDAKFRIVTTQKRLPSDKDLMGVINHGMPGSMMVPFAHLSESDRSELAKYVRQLTVEGFADGVRRQQEQAGQTVNWQETLQDAREALDPGQPIEIPALPASSPASIAAGKAFYLKNCNQCHGDTGKGDGSQDQRDDNGLPT